ncbi:MAG: efflux RND transporter permease subunit [Erysipelotrichaceae bacterium]
MIKYSVKKIYTVIVSMILVLVLGIISFTGLKTDLLPAMELPYMMVMTTYPGASPEKVEVAISDPLESVISTTGGLSGLTSISQENASIIILEFVEGTNMDTAMIEVNNAIQRVSGNFDDLVGAPTLMNINPTVLPIIQGAIDVEGMDIIELSELFKEDILPQLERVDGVASISSGGIIENQLLVELSQEKIDAINDKIIASVDQDLLKTKNQITSGLAQVNSAQSELDNKTEEFYNQLAEASNQLNSGIATYSYYQAEVSKYTTIVLSISNKMAELTLVELSKYDDSMPLATAGISDSTILSYLGAFALNGSIDMMGSVGAASEALADLIEDNNTTLTNLGKDISVDIVYDDDLLKQLKTNMEALNSATALMNSYQKTLTGLQNKYASLEAQKMSITQNFTEGSVTLSNSEAELQGALSEFNMALDKALASANIDSLVTSSMISNIIMAENFSMPAGYISVDESSYTVKVGELFNNIEELENLLVLDMNISGLEPIYLKDVADFNLADNSGASYAKVNGNNAIIFNVQKDSEASTSEVSSAINNKIAELEAEYQDLSITPIMDQGVYIDLVVGSVMDNLLYGAIIAFIVLALFLKNLRPTIVVAVSIPMSLLFAVVLMYFSNVTLNIISLFGLALGTGMLVDNSIVVIENIYRLRNEGMSAFEASIKGASQVAGAIASSTLTTICVFVPIVFTEGISRQLFTDMGLTIAYSLIASLIVALTVVPAMAAKTLKNSEEKSSKWFDKLVKIYENTLEKSLNKKSIVLVGALLLFVFSGFMVTKMPTTFIPEMDSPQMSMTLTGDKDSTKEEVQATSEIIVERLSEIEDIDAIGVVDASSYFISGGANAESLSFYLTLKDNKKLTSQEIAKLIEEKTADLNIDLTITASNMDMSALGGSGVSIEIQGDNLDTLAMIASDISDIVSNVDGVESVDDGNGAVSEEVRIIVDKNKAMAKGMSVAQVYNEVSNYLSTETSSTTLSLAEGEIDVVIKSAHQPNLNDLKNLEITSSTATNTYKFKLADIASVENAQTPQAINRIDQVRTQSVNITLNSDAAANFVSNDIEKLLADYEAPKGYSITVGGENETVTQAMGDIALMILLAIVFIYLIMVAQFQSLVSPFIVIFTIPLAFTGGLLALLITGIELSVIALLGFLILSGIVVNNGIVFVDYVNQLRAQGVSKKEALLLAGKHRMRPILMTALTTILAMSTMVLGVGLAGALTQAMSVVAMGGLIYSTLLTLFVVPAIYDLVVK